MRGAGLSVASKEKLEVTLKQAKETYRRTTVNTPRIDVCQSALAETDRYNEIVRSVNTYLRTPRLVHGVADEKR